SQSLNIRITTSFEANMFPAFIIALIFLVVEFIVGITANGLMIVVNCSEWIRSRKLTFCDMILTSLGISRFFLQCMILINALLFALPTGMKGNIFSLWFATWLSIFFCMKIANFSQPLCDSLLQPEEGLLPQLLMGSLLVSLVTCLPSANNIHRIYTGNSTNILSRNTTMECRHEGNLSTALSVLSMLGYSCPFVIFIVPAVLLFASLWRYIKRVEKATSSSKDTIDEAHVRTIKGLIFHFLLRFLFCGTNTIFVSYISELQLQLHKVVGCGNGNLSFRALCDPNFG
uniref:Taste receptor type 2 n=1 Tax=Pelusios castaneus TaxID=367368 RepID=A0A8C8S523_9SAUR